MPDTVDLEGIKDVVADEAPVFDPEPLSGKEKAGVSLTWGIIAVLVFFLLIILAVFLWGEYKFMICFEQLSDLKEASSEKINEIAKLITILETKQASFRTFWFDTLQLIILNILFPTLTALLGYVFGTSKNNSSNS
ncbi:MAG: hypothetical protein BA863_11125 [Desulfovibrio sp. S3730MH75]|nr:MAG: hypothetical protein BA863_11125 [Desulfovibrio sp. S3730MH75]